MPKTKRQAIQPDGATQAIPATNEPGSGRAASLRAAGRIGRAQILGKYWELANLDPEITKGTITGQLKALDSLCQELTLDESGDAETAGEQKQQIYRSAWLREAAGNPERPAPSPRGKSAATSKRPSSRTRTKAADDE